MKITTVIRATYVKLSDEIFLSEFRTKNYVMFLCNGHKPA